VLLQGGTDHDRALSTTSGDLLKRLARVETIEWLHADAEPPLNALALVGELKVMVPLVGLIDLGAEQARLGKDVAKKQQELERLQQKLANPNFADKAPADVVAKERQKLADAEAALATLQTQLASIAGL